MVDQRREGVDHMPFRGHVPHVGCDKAAQARFPDRFMDTEADQVTPMPNSPRVDVDVLTGTVKRRPHQERPATEDYDPGRRNREKGG